jgi:triacylglycerol lipase
VNIDKDQEIAEELTLTAKMARIASVAYLPHNAALPRFRDLGFPKVKFIDYHGTQCYIAWNNEQIVVAFRGTEPTQWNDIKADLRAWLMKDDECVGRVHSGFHHEVHKILDRVQITVGQMRHRKKLYITGHSLGGAMATVAATKLENVDLLCTFGSPRVGTNKFVKNIPARHIRYVNNNDVVPSMPPAILFYKHHGEERYINYHGKVRKMTFWQRIKDKWRGRISSFKKKIPFDGIYDHDVKYYIRYTEMQRDENG